MNNNILKIVLSILCLAVIVVFISSLLFSSFPQKKNEPENISPESVYSQTGAPIKTYILKEYQNHIAVFEDSNDQPYKIIDIDISTLPLVDQQILNKGIRVTSETDLRHLIQDYES